MTTINCNIECDTCKGVFTLTLDTVGYSAYTNGGVLVQDAFPYLSVGERELIISQTCGECFDKMFAEPLTNPFV